MNNQRPESEPRQVKPIGYQPNRCDMPQPRSARGLTFVEVMIAVTIIAIAAALVIPMFSQTESTRLRSAAKLLAADLAYAQIESIAHADDPRIVVFDQVNHEYHIAARSAPATPITNPVGNLPYLTTFGSGRASEASGVTIQDVSLGGDDNLGFGIYGQLDQTTDATITLANSNFSITLTIDPVTGEVAISHLN